MDLAQLAGNQNKFGNTLRDNKDDKINYSLAVHPLVLKKLAEHMTSASYSAGGKYPKWNWTGGMPRWQCLESLERHLTQYKLGQHDEEHVVALVFNAMNLIYNDEIEKMSEIQKEEFEKHMKEIYGKDYCSYSR